MNLAQCIAADRRRLGMSQMQLAQSLGVSQQSVSKWEEGTARPRGKRIRDLVAALGKKSMTAEALAVTTTEKTMHTAHPEALAELAQAAQQVAQAAMSLAKAVEKLAQAPPDPQPKH